ncbi:MAG: DUF4271 domain-containing protein [Cyclobacteriaceae bacterium]
MKLLLIFILVLAGPEREKELQVTEDLTNSLKIVNSEGRFAQYQGQKTSAVHFGLNLIEKNGFIEIESKRSFYLFINSSLITRKNYFRLNTDSLMKIYQSKIFLSIYQADGVSDLSVKLLKLSPVDQFANPFRQNDSFNNFILISTLVLIVFFTALLRTNPQLTLDYLNFSKLVSLRDRDESQITLRITSSVNFLFYSFAGLLASSALLIASHFSPLGLTILSHSTENTSIQYFGLWLLIAVVVVALLMIKLGLAKIASQLYGWRDLAGFQFFNFVRALVLILILMGTLGIICFSLGFTANYYFFIKLSCILLTVSAGLLYLKLLAKAQFSSFHLFSYLCATEFIPLIILIKVFLN